MAFTVAGAAVGFTYWRVVGCQSGSCPLTANWHTSVLFGSMIGFLAVPSAKKNKKQADEGDQTINDNQATSDDNQASDTDQVINDNQASDTDQVIKGDQASDDK